MKIQLPKLLKLLESGLSVITIGDSKIPNVKWKPFMEQPATYDEFTKIYKLASTKGQGIVTGYDGLEVIDVDLKVLPSLKEQTDFWNELISFLRDNIDEFDSKFVIYKTVNKGYHILYKCDKVDGSKKLAKLKGEQEAIIETRGKGGYVFIYENKISEFGYTDIKKISIEDREILLNICSYYNYIEEAPIEAKKNEPRSVSDTEEDYNSKTNIFDVIGDDFTVVRNLSSQYVIRRIGAQSPHSGYVYKDSNAMYLFSTGTFYPVMRLIKPHYAYACKFHNGNVNKALKDLYSKGFGTRIVKENEALKAIKIASEDLVFPIEIFPVNVQKYITECNNTLDSSIDYMGCSLIWMVSVIIGNSIKVKVKEGWVEGCTTWVSIVGKAGLGKTPSISNIIFPLLKMNNREIKRYMKQRDKFDAYTELTKDEKKEVPEEKKPIKTQFIANDITMEALVDLHEENKNGIGVFKDELAGWIKDMNKYKQGSDLEFWLSTWSGKAVSINRKTAKNSFVNAPLIPVLGGIQPSILSNFYTDDNKENGFIDRLLLCFPELTIDKYNEKEMNQEIIQWYDDYIVNFYTTIRSMIQYDDEDEIEPIITDFSKDAKKEWTRIFNNISELQNSDTENEYMKSMLPKQKSYIPRFALIIQALKSYDSDKNAIQIEKESMLLAEKLSNYFIFMSKKIKVNSIEIKEYKDIARRNEGKSTFEKFKAMYEADSDLNKREAAEILNISRQMIYKYINEITKYETTGQA